MKKSILLFFIALAAFAGGGIGICQERAAKIPAGDFERLHKSIMPQPGESPWRDIAWVTNITEARRRAVSEDKPLVIFTAADGSPLSRT